MGLISCSTYNARSLSVNKEHFLNKKSGYIEETRGWLCLSFLYKGFRCRRNYRRDFVFFFLRSKYAASSLMPHCGTLQVFLAERRAFVLTHINSFSNDAFGQDILPIKRATLDLWSLCSAKNSVLNGLFTKRLMAFSASQMAVRRSLSASVDLRGAGSVCFTGVGTGGFSAFFLSAASLILNSRRYASSSSDCDDLDGFCGIASSCQFCCQR